MIKACPPTRTVTLPTQTALGVPGPASQCSSSDSVGTAATTGASAGAAKATSQQVSAMLANDPRAAVSNRISSLCLGAGVTP
jgi:hypothetical protein